MNKLIHTGLEIGYEKSSALDYFHDGTDNRYIDENKYKVVATKEKEITDEEQIKEGLRDWLWRVDVYLQESSNDWGTPMDLDRLPCDR